jgi:hypothetical protein
MTGYLMSGLLAAALAMQASAGAPGKTPGKDAPKEMRLTGCVAKDRVVPGQFTFQEADSGWRYRLTGKGLKNFVGHRVEIVGGPPGKGVTFRTGLYPSPNTAAQAGALDPAKAAIATLPGGAADAPSGTALPEFHVIRLHDVEGACL